MNFQWPALHLPLNILQASQLNINRTELLVPSSRMPPCPADTISVTNIFDFHSHLCLKPQNDLCDSSGVSLSPDLLPSPTDSPLAIFSPSTFPKCCSQLPNPGSVLVSTLLIFFVEVLFLYSVFPHLNATLFQPSGVSSCFEPIFLINNMHIRIRLGFHPERKK